MSVKLLIVFYSRGGSTEALAKAIGEGAAAEGAEVRIRRARELVSREIMEKVPGWADAADRMNAEYEAPTAADADWADAIVIGSPTRFGSASSEIRAYIDGLGGLWFQGKLNGKAGGAFSSTQSLHGGNEATILGLWATLAHLGFIIVPTGYADPAAFAAGTPYGVTNVTGQAGSLPTDAMLTLARFQGKRTAEVAKALRGA